MNLLTYLRSFIARTFLTAYAGPGFGKSGPIVVSPPPGEEIPEPEPKEEPKAKGGDEGKDPVEDDGEEEDPDAEPEADPETDLDDDDDDDDDDDEEKDEEEEDEEDEDADLLIETYETRLAATLPKGRDERYDVNIPDLDAPVLTPERRKALIAKLTPKDAEDDEVTGAGAIVDTAEEIAKDMVLSILSRYHNEAVVPVRRNLDTAAGRAALEKEGQKLAAKYPELADEKLQRKIVDGPLAHFDKKFGPAARAHLPLKQLLRMVPKKARLAARARVLAAGGGKTAGKREETETERSAREREVALGGSSAPRGTGGKTAPSRKKKPDGDAAERAALTDRITGKGRKVPYF